VTADRRHPNVVHADDVDVEPIVIERGMHRFRRRSFGVTAGNRQLGGSLLELAPARGRIRSTTTARTRRRST